MEAKRFYFKTHDGKAWWSLKSPEKPEAGAVEITKEEWDDHIAELEAAREQAEH